MRVRVDWRVSCRLVGTLLKWLWIPLLIPLSIALYDGSALRPFVLPMLGTAALGVGLERLIEERELLAREAFVFFILATVFVVVDASRVQLTVTEFEAMSAAAATLFNVGPAFGIAGPMESYDPVPRSTKLAMTFLMWVGRIEIIPVLVLLTPSYWRS